MFRTVAWSFGVVYVRLVRDRQSLLRSFPDYSRVAKPTSAERSFASDDPLVEVEGLLRTMALGLMEDDLVS